MISASIYRCAKDLYDLLLSALQGRMTNGDIKVSFSHLLGFKH